MRVKELDLSLLREAIDRVDHQILELLRERLGYVLQVGEHKRHHGIQVYDPTREREMLDRLASACKPPLKPDTVRRVFERIIDESRSQEQHHVSEAPDAQVGDSQ